MKVIACETCGKQFSFFPAAKRRFCSLSCSGKFNGHKRSGFRNVTLVCDNCGKIFIKKKCEVTKHNKQKLINHFCSHECAGLFFLNTSRPNTSKSLANAYQSGRMKPSKYKNGGFRKDIGIYVRSGWEANVARIFNLLNIDWEYEPKGYDVCVDGEKTTYFPDFYLKDNDSFVEVKGFWFNEKARKKFEQFSINHPTLLLDRSKYVYLQKQFLDRVAWEGRVYGD